MEYSLSEELKKRIGFARNCLERMGADPLPHFVDGKRFPGYNGETFDNHTPVDNSLLNRVCSGSVAEIDLAARAADEAFESWRDMPGEARKKILHEIADAIEKRADEIAVVESMDTGQPIRFMSSAALRGAENFRFFADRAPDAANGLSLPSEGYANFTGRQPIGPVGVITPWNTPFMLSTWKIAPALAAGCTVVHKPAEWSPLTAMMLAEICFEAGLPKGALNLVNGFGETAGKALTEHPLIKAIAFVGESSTGSLIQAQAAQTLKRLHFELGGKNPVIVFDDADLERALDAAVFMIYSLNGERCTSSSRLLVQEGVYEEFVAQVADRARKIRIGHPLDPATELGPLIHPAHFDKVHSYFDLARLEGATVAAGGASASTGLPGNFVQPTLFTGANTSMRIAQEEIFGPVLTAIPFKDEADAVRIANDVRYGLAAYLWTRDVGRSLRVSKALNVGMVWVNSENVRHLPTPFGGMKASGVGRDGGDYSFDFYMETKNVAIAFGSRKIPQLGKA